MLLLTTYSFTHSLLTLKLRINIQGFVNAVQKVRMYIYRGLRADCPAYSITYAVVMLDVTGAYAKRIKCSLHLLTKLHENLSGTGHEL